jgi:hypothetical protein
MASYTHSYDGSSSCSLMIFSSTTHRGQSISAMSASCLNNCRPISSTSRNPSASSVHDLWPTSAMSYRPTVPPWMGKGAYHTLLATTHHHLCCSRVPQSYGLLPVLHQGLRGDRSPSNTTPMQGQLPLVTRGRGGLPSPLAGTDNGSGASTPCVRLGVHH